MRRYPLLTGRGFKLCYDDRDSPPGITFSDVINIFSFSERKKFYQYLNERGGEFNANGVDPCYVEDFLEALNKIK